MSTRKSVMLVGSFFVLALIGLMILVGLAAVLGPRLIRPVERPAHSQLGTSSWALSTPVAYVTLPPRNRPSATPAPNSALASAPASSAALAVDNDAPAVTSDAALEVSVVQPRASADLVADTSAGSFAPAPPLAAMPAPTLVAPGRISGRVLLDGVPVGGVQLRLEDTTYNTIAGTTVKPDGSYVFSNVHPSSQGYSLVFAQEWNTQYEVGEVISWGWIGPVAVDGDIDVQLPDFDISPQEFGQVSPEPNAAVSATALSPARPLQFEWTEYPRAITYWVDLAQGEEDNQQVVWQSPLRQGDSLFFDGTLGDGGRIQIGDYWWGVGARDDSGPYPVTVYGYLSALRIKP